MSKKWKILPVECGDKEIVIHCGGIRVLVDYDDVDPDQAKTVASHIGAAKDLVAAADAAIRYDNAIRACANSPESMSSFCTAEGDGLDTLYADWISKARSAAAKARGEK